MTSTRRPATAADFVKGGIVYKGNGKVAYRIWSVRTVAEHGADEVGLVKATTETDPTRSTWWGTHELTVEVTEAPAAEVIEDTPEAPVATEIPASGTVVYTPSETNPEEPIVTTAVATLAGTPSEYRGWQNALATLRRHGFLDPKKPHKKKD